MLTLVKGTGLAGGDSSVPTLACEKAGQVPLNLLMLREKLESQIFILNLLAPFSVGS